MKKNNNDGASFRRDKIKASGQNPFGYTSTVASQPKSSGSDKAFGVTKQMNDSMNDADAKIMPVEKNAQVMDSNVESITDASGGDGSGGSLTIGDDTYTVTKSDPSSNGTGSARPTFAANEMNRLSSADHTGGPMMKDLFGKGKTKEDGASFRLFGIGKLSEGQKRRRGITSGDDDSSKTSTKSDKNDMSSKKQKVGDLKTKEVGGSVKRNSKASTTSTIKATVSKK